MDGRITRLIDDQQFGIVSGEDGADYTFASVALIGATFGDLHVGATVSFTPIIGPAYALHAEGVRLISE
jgi:hypothetical protein